MTFLPLEICLLAMASTASPLFLFARLLPLLGVPASEHLSPMTVTDPGR